MAHFIIWNTLDNDDLGAVRPVGPHQLSSWLSNFGYEVKVIDFCSMMSPLTLATLTSKFIDKHTVGVGVSSTFWKSTLNLLDAYEPNWVVQTRELLSLRYPDLDWVLGGAIAGHVTNQHWTKIIGYAEDGMLKYLNEKTEQKTLFKAFDIKRLDHHYMDDLGIQPGEVLPMELGRGCQFKCKFCRFGLLGKKKGTYIRDYELIEQELLSNYERYGTTRYSFVDDTVNESIEKIHALADIASRLPFKLEWIGYNRLDLIAAFPETVELLPASGLRGAFFGIESFHPQASLAVGKGWNGRHGKDMLLRLKEEWGKRVSWHLSLLVGRPGEPMEHMQQTQDWCIENEMHHWHWIALSISRNPDLEWKSEFDIHYADYGYRFIDPANDMYWTTDLFDLKTASEASRKLVAESRKYVKVTPWEMSKWACDGTPFDDIMHKKVSEVDYEGIRQRTKKMVSDYVEFQKKN